MNKFLKKIKEIGQHTSDIECILVVGSVATETNTIGSDLDIMIITANKSFLVQDKGFIEYFGIVIKSKIEYYGAYTSIRVWYQDENEIEFGMVDPSWIFLPLDSSTRKVLTEGCIRSSLIRNIIVKIYHFKKYIFFCKKYLRKLCIYYIILRQLVP
ncbi:nucleotidyltransferase domain-containing protein [Faecalitalea cylindroides]|uniref:nucleotidyltransferase domain-containing protein n=1 Tax=Faecalitalea cylindroides TaxID=39483 RepID=UPI003B96FB70